MTIEDLSYTLDALQKPNVKEAIFAGLDVLQTTNNTDKALEAALLKGAQNGGAAELAGGVFADVAKFAIQIYFDYEKSQKR